MKRVQSRWSWCPLIALLVAVGGCGGGGGGDGDLVADGLRVAAGQYHSLAVKTDGTLWAWGLNDFGQLGTSTQAGIAETGVPVPARVGTDSDWTAVAAGFFFSLGLKSDGTLWAWGDNQAGELATTANLGTTVPNPVPLRVGTDSDWASMTGGNAHVLALKSDGTLWGWGYNQHGQLGTTTNVGTADPLVHPARIGTASDWVAVKAGDLHSLGLKGNGTLWGWGYNQYGALGTTTNVGTATPIPLPARIGTGSDWAAVHAGGIHSVGLKSDGTLWGWGYNRYGSAGTTTNTGTHTPIPLPSRVGAGSDWTAVKGGYFHSLALRSDGTLWAWGYNAHGRLGTNTNFGGIIPLPAQVGASPWYTAGGGGALSGGNNHSLGFMRDGTLWAWGSNYYGQVGTTTGLRNYLAIPARIAD